MANETSLTPMMEQYFRIKSEHRDALLFFRLGDFYEMFYEDAKTAAPLLGLALTSRQKVPMCGVPYHAVNSYLTKLLRLDCEMGGVVVDGLCRIQDRELAAELAGFQDES